MSEKFKNVNSVYDVFNVIRNTFSSNINSSFYDELNSVMVKNNLNYTELFNNLTDKNKNDFDLSIFNTDNIKYDDLNLNNLYDCDIMFTNHLFDILSIKDCFKLLYSLTPSNEDLDKLNNEISSLDGDISRIKSHFNVKDYDSDY